MDEELKQKVDEIKAKLTVPFVARAVIKGIAKHSVGFVAAKFAKEYCPTENKKQELQVAIGAYVVGGMAGDAAANWAEREFDEGLEFVMSIVNRTKENLKTSEEKPELTVIPTE